MAERRTVVESERYKRERDELSKDVERMDEMLDGVITVISRAPHLGLETDNPDILGIAAWVWGCPTDFVIYYRIRDDDIVVLESIIKGIGSRF